MIALCAAVPGLPFGIASCSDKDPASAAADATDEVSHLDHRDVAVVIPDEDAGPDQAAPPPPVVPACVGTAIPLNVAGERAYVSIELAGEPDASPSRGDWVVDLGSTGSTIDFGAFGDAGPTPSICYGDAAAPGADCVFHHFDYFGEWGNVTLRTGDYGALATLTRQAGILGTDFLALHPTTLDYTRGKIYRAEPKAFCTDAQLLGAGYTPLPSQGFYTTDLSKLRPLSDVLTDPDGGTAGFVVPNVPTVPVAIAGKSALAQLDTGYDDRLVHHSINVNQALFDLIQSQGPNFLTRDVFSDVYLTTCIPGYSEQVSAYRLGDGQTVDFIAEGGSVARRESTAVVYLKKHSVKTLPCGGIGTWTVPAAQIGSSFFVDAQAIVFDPTSSRVWVPKN